MINVTEKRFKELFTKGGYKAVQRDTVIFGEAFDIINEETEEVEGYYSKSSMMGNKNMIIDRLANDADKAYHFELLYNQTVKELDECNYHRLKVAFPRDKIISRPSKQ